MPEPMTIAQLPAEMRPREKLLKHGASALTDTELLALFLRQFGTHSRQFLTVIGRQLGQLKLIDQGFQFG